MPWVVMPCPKPQVPAKFLLVSMEYHWPSDYPGCPALLGGDTPYIGFGLCTTLLELLQEIGQGTTFGDTKEGSPFSPDSVFGHLLS